MTAYSVSPVSATIMRDALRARPTDVASAINASSAKRSERGTIVTGGAGAVDDPRPDNRRYAAVGDAVTVQVAQWIGWRLAEFERGES